MTDPIIPEKLRDLAQSADEGELERLIGGAFIQTADALRAAADEIERLSKIIRDLTWLADDGLVCTAWRDDADLREIIPGIEVFHQITNPAKEG